MMYAEDTFAELEAALAAHYEADGCAGFYCPTAEGLRRARAYAASEALAALLDRREADHAAD